MDDIRGRYRVPRRNYSSPEPRRPQPADNRPADGSGPPAVFQEAQTAAGPYRPSAASPFGVDDSAPIGQRYQNDLSHSHRPAQARRPKRLGRKLLLTAVLALLLVGGGYYLIFQRESNPAPKSVRQSVDYPVYYPDPKKLPKDYVLDQSSFKTPSANTIVYAVDAGGQNLVVSLQPKPAADKLQSLINQSLPLHTDLSTPLGKAVIGAFNSQTVALVAAPQALIIVTAPQDVSQADVKQVLTSLKP